MSFFVEVGACDFDTCEQLIKNGWKGLVIEPVKVYFDRLPKYDSIIYENIAIDSNKRTICYSLYRSKVYNRK